MKKILFFVLFFLSTTLFWGCEKLCVCTLPGSTPTEIDINPSESCSDYSNAERGNCN